MRSLVLLLTLLSFLVIQPAMADDHPESHHADYAVLLGGSPFGGSISFASHQSKKTSFLFSLGGAPEGIFSMDDSDIGGNKYDIESHSSWVGAFVNHRPIESAEWFRLVAGLGIGNIENKITAEDGAVYHANYTENPVGYLGIGFGVDTSAGFQWGVDLGWLQTAGPQVTGPNAEVIEDIKDNWMFGKVLPNFQVSLGYGF